MASVTQAGAEGRSLFVRNATGLVRGWSPFDGFVYAFFSCNIIFGFWVLTFGPFIPSGSLFWAVIIATAFVLFEVVIYAGLVAAMPRAGGDYVWQSRILGGPAGFVLAVTGWWFILWHWIPLYANITVLTFFNPLLSILGAHGAADWFTGKNGIFVSSLIVIALTAIYVGLGMRGYAKVQKTTFYFGMIGLVVAAILLLTHTKSDFVSSFNREAQDIYGAKPGAYDATLHAGAYSHGGAFSFHAGGTFLLIPILLFYLLWPNWGATLYGEVRGAREFRKNVYAMASGLLLVTLISLVFIVLMSKTVGWDWWNAANNAYWAGKSPISTFPYPVLLASWLVPSHAFQFILIGATALLVFGWYGTSFLSSTRVIFAAAFDRVLPEWVATVSPRTRTPNVALALMILPSIGVAALYAYWSNFATYTLDTTLVIAVTYLGTTVAAAIMPWRLRRVYEASPLARWSIGGIPLITLASLVFGGFLIFNLVYWLKDSVYGVNNKQSLIYMGILYSVAILIYVVASTVRRRQGMPLTQVQREIPVE